MLYGHPGSWQRVASLRPFRLPGGDKVIHQPWRTALSLSWHAGFDWSGAPDADPLLRRAWSSGLASPWTSAAGRLFDGAAALAGVATRASFEGQGPGWLEALAAHGEALNAPAPELKDDDDGLVRADWGPLMAWMADESLPAADRAAGFHRAMGELIGAIVDALSPGHRFRHVGLTGGVFQNALLSSIAMGQIERRGIAACLPGLVPVNDAGISYGQVIEAACAP